MIFFRFAKKSSLSFTKQSCKYYMVLEFSRFCCSRIPLGDIRTQMPLVLAEETLPVSP